MNFRFVIATALVALSLVVAPAAHATPLVAGPPCPPGTYVNLNDISGPCLSNTPGNDYLAYAVSVSANRTFWGTGASEREADTSAMVECAASTNSACDLIAHTRNGCIAIASGDLPNSEGVIPSEAGVGPSADAASADAVARLHGGQVYDLNCSGS
ncbi:DUF4189 domain-containing protein [Mycobacterium sp. NBC_00419]|uniref:DUF4189 domain-containing protein n=1 Tax=Mycobacterium sp. NBC_00419 TaxID=2975989 RepID=UPI003FA60FAE